MTKILLLFFLIFTQFRLATAVLVGDMPFFDGNPPNIEQYAGYISVPFTNPSTEDTYNHELFYVFVVNPDPDAPLIVWLNGGPGCTSMDGYLRENGPYIVKMADNDEGFTVEKNEFAWTHFAHVLYIDSPIGTGFSYSDTPQDYTEYLGDEFTKNDLLSFLITFFDEEFPDYLPNELYIAGESYGGHYVPQLTQAIVQYNNHPDTLDPFNLGGYIIGDGVTDYYYMLNSLPEFLLNNFLISRAQYNQTMSDCEGNIFANFMTVPACNAAFMGMSAIMFMGFLNLYNVKHDCEMNGPADMTCIDTTTLDNYCNSDDFLQAFDLADKVALLPEEEFVFCTPEESFVYNGMDAYTSMIPIHLNLTGPDNVTLLFYSGDSDSSVNSLGSLKIFEEALMSPEAKWSYETMYYSKKNVLGVEIDQVGGFLKEEGNIKFVMVRDAGHQAPIDQPKFVQELVMDFVGGYYDPEEDDQDDDDDDDDNGDDVDNVDEDNSFFLSLNFFLI